MLSVLFTFHSVEEVLLAFLILLEVPIAMILLSLLLRRREDRFVIDTANTVTILWIIGGITVSASDISYATVGVAVERTIL